MGDWLSLQVPGTHWSQRQEGGGVDAGTQTSCWGTDGPKGASLLCWVTIPGFVYTLEGVWPCGGFQEPWGWEEARTRQADPR